MKTLKLITSSTININFKLNPQSPIHVHQNVHTIESELKVCYCLFIVD